MDNEVMLLILHERVPSGNVRMFAHSPYRLRYIYVEVCFHCLISVWNPISIQILTLGLVDHSRLGTIYSSIFTLSDISMTNMALLSSLELAPFLLSPPFIGGECFEGREN